VSAWQAWQRVANVGVITVARSLAGLPQIPDSVRSDLLRVVEYAHTIRDVLRETKTEAPSTSALKFVSLFAERLSIPYNDAGRLLATLQHVLSIGQEAGETAKTFEIIAARLPEEARQEWSKQEPEINEILMLLADNHPAVISYKAQRLSHSYERILMDAEILTDVRPVYTIKGDKILEMIIQHKLIITQHDRNHRNGDIHFAMDAQDVVNLRKACDRAIQKAKILKDSFGNLPWVTEVLSDDEQT
jgi:mRNA-degrading endonuclease YafQ of YafQ-DinJ toxin-antitoxin module